MRLELTPDGNFSATFERTPFFFQEYGVAINALGQTIADGPNPNGPVLSAEQQIEHFTEIGLFDLLGRIRGQSISMDTSRPDEEKKAEPVVAELAIEANETELTLLAKSLTNYHETTDREVASVRGFNPAGATNRKLEGGMAARMYKIIEEAIPSVKIKQTKKPTVGFGRVLD